MSQSSVRFRLLIVLSLVVALAAIGASVRWMMLPWALERTLKAAGASDVTFAVVRATPWRLQLANIGFAFPAVRLRAQEASLERRHWWTPSLGKLRVAAARAEIEGAKFAGAPAGKEPVAPPTRIPFEEISFDGQISVRSGDMPTPTVTVKFAARPASATAWQADAALEAPGLALEATATYELPTGTIDFQAKSLRLELQSWQAWTQQWMPVPGGPWEFAGVLTGEAKGSWRDGQLVAAGNFHLREARFANTRLGITAEKVESDLEVTDLARFLTPKATVRAGLVTSGKIVATAVNAEFSRTVPERFDVARVSARALGGALSIEPFAYRLDSPVLEAVIRAEGIRAEEVLALTQNLPAQATGALSGRMPVRYEGSQLRFGTGWLGLQEGSSAEIQFRAEGLLTAGTSPKSPSYAVLKKVEDGILKLKVNELRLEIRPPNVPANRSAQLHVVGTPVDPTVKAPVTLDLNVNGPFESLLNLGLKSQLSTGTKP